MRSIGILKKCIEGPKKRMAMMTFTRNAAAEMEERLMGELTSMSEDGRIDQDAIGILT